MINKIKETAAYLKSNISEVPEILVVLGSGLGDFATGVENAKVFNYEDIPNFHKPTVEGHDGKLFLGRMSGKKVVVMSGRFHFYEGHDLNEVVFPLSGFYCIHSFFLYKISIQYCDVHTLNIVRSFCI